MTHDPDDCLECRNAVLTASLALRTAELTRLSTLLWLLTRHQGGTIELPEAALHPPDGYVALEFETLPDGGQRIVAQLLPSLSLQ